mmetsp:Transcript_5863/g.7933  ORF Transcript_5863/g.7933 Transcript_5863/m.7933 type:complete len:166 (+) Transcript_5863:323-820(+)
MDNHAFKSVATFDQDWITHQGARDGALEVFWDLKVFWYQSHPRVLITHNLLVDWVMHFVDLLIRTIELIIESVGVMSLITWHFLNNLELAESFEVLLQHLSLLLLVFSFIDLDLLDKLDFVGQFELFFDPEALFELAMALTIALGAIKGQFKLSDPELDIFVSRK